MAGLGRDADLFICECYMYEQPVRAHLALTRMTTTS